MRQENVLQGETPDDRILKKIYFDRKNFPATIEFGSAVPKNQKKF